MKPIYGLVILLAASAVQAQTLTQAPETNATLPPPTPYAAAWLDANSTIWQRTTYDQAPDGSIVPQSHQYNELATGLNHLVNGQWVASKEEIDISPDGSSASATNGQHRVYFPGNIYSGNIKLVTPDGQKLQSQPIGLAYFDGSNSVLLAMVTNSTGAILPSGNEVIYTNAFAGLKSDLLYRYTKAGAEQDVVLRQQPPDPTALGLNAAKTRLQMITEFIVSPQPTVTATTVPTDAGNLEDDSLSFGAMQMGQGRAFLLSASSPSVRVNKQWVVLQGRQFLIEEVPIVTIATAIDTLPPYVAQAGDGIKPVASKNLILPPQRLTRTTPKTTFIAQAEPPQQGLVLDYITMISQTNYTFQGDMTYYISGVVNLAGTNTFEGGTSLKFATNATINIAGINCLTAPYRPVYFTGKDDDRTGEWISGSTHNPTGYYANPALNITAPGQTLSNFRIAYAQQAIATTVGSESFYNGQFVNCGFGLTASGTTNFLRNVLFANVTTNFNNLSSAIIDVQNGSFGPSAYLASVGTSVSVIVTNSVLAYVTNLYSGSPTVSTGAYNGFFASTEFGAGALTNNSYPFQTVGAGAYYMASSSAFTNVGTANIDPTLLTYLTNLTAYPPILYSNVPVTNLTFSLQAQRDTNTAPDLGYHYAPIDYFFGGCTASSNITFTAGTAAGWFDLPGYNNAPGWGISLQGQIIVAFNGTVTAPCVWARYETVQEGGNGLWVAKDYVGGLASYQGNSYDISIAPQIVANFTHFAEMWGDPNHFRDYSTPLIASVKNSEFWSGSVGAYNNSCYWTNCLAYRMTANQVQGYNASNAFIMRNCTWHGGQVIFTANNNSIPLSVRDCAFDGTAFTIQNYGTNGDYDYNAYTNGAAMLSPSGAHNITNIVNYNWQSNWFGSFYLPSNSSLTNAGDVPASQVGLYHFTILTNQVPEGTNIVSIGYHYVAADAFGNPLDTDGDGIPDYLEDANGDGIYDSGDPSDWQDYYNGVLPTLTIISGNNQTGMPGTFLPLPLIVSVTGTNGLALTNAPLTFAVAQGAAQVALATNGTFTTSLNLRTDSNGLASIFVLLPSTLSTTNSITATAWSGANSNQVTFTATTMGGLRLWLRADLGVTNNGSGQISAWGDQSGNHYTAAQTITSRQPTYVTNALNGLPIVRFNPTNFQNLTLSNVLVGTTGAEAYVVLKAAVDTPGVQRGLWHMGSGCYSCVSYPNTSGQIVDDFGSGAAYTVGNPAQPLDQYHVYEAAGQANHWSAWINGVLQSENFTNAYGFNTSPALGYSGNAYFGGDVAEVLIFNRVLTISERDAVNNYVNLKYALESVPLAPTTLSALAISGSQISLTWNYNLGNSSTLFQISRSTISNGVYTIIGTTRDSIGYMDTGLTAGTTYYYQVTAVNSAGSSAPSNIAWATTLSGATDLPLSNLLLWLKADSGVVRQGGNGIVAAWFDQTAQHDDATQLTASKQPLYVTNAINGLPIVRFNPTNSQDFSLSNFLGGLTGAEAFVVLKVAVPVPSQVRALWQWGHGPPGWNAYPNSSGQIVEDFGSTSRYTVNSPTQPLNQYHVYEVAGQSNYWAAWLNGILQNTANVNISGFNTTLALGYNGNNYFDGDVAEVLIFNRTLSAGERWTVNSYLNSKFGLVTNLPSAPTNLLASAISTNQIGLTWSFNLGASSTMFDIARSATSNGVYTIVAQVANALSYVDTNLPAGTTYYYEVAAQNTAGMSGYSNPAWATTPTNGATLPFNNLLLWLKADTGVVAPITSTNAGEWFDQSGNYNNATQTTVSYQPLYVTNAINGLPVVRFNRTNSQYLLMTNFLVGTTQAEVFVVLKSADLPSTTTALWNMGAGIYSLVGYPYNNGQIVEDFGSTSTYTVGRPVQPLSQYHVFEVAGQTNFWGAWVNGVLQYQTPVNAYGVNTSYAYLDLGCSYYGSSPFSYFSGDVAEMLIFNRTLSTGERWTVNTYLSLKYGLVTNAPPTPTNLAANAISTNQIGLTWNFNFGTSSTIFQVARAMTSNGVYTVVGQVAGALSYVDTNLAAGTTYYYEVAAENAAGTSGYSNPAWATTSTNEVSLPFGNLALWLKADSGVATLTTSYNVGEWFDQSGNYKNATQTTASHQPLYVTNAINGLPVVRFNPTNSQYFSLSNFLNGTTGAEAFVVLKVAVPVPGQIRALWQWGHGPAWDAYPNTSGQIVEDFGTTSTYTIGKPVQPLNQYHVYEVVGQPNFWEAWVNGLPLASTNYSTYGVNATPMLGYSGNNYFGGDVGEVLVFNRTLTMDERDVVSGYLVTKYGLAQFATNAAPPIAPTNLMTIGLAPYQLNLQWASTSSNVGSYHVERELGTNGGFGEIGAVSAPVTNFVDTTAPPTNLYYYRIRAHNLFGDSYSSVISPPTVCMTNWPVTTLENATNALGAQAADANGVINSVGFFVGNNVVLIGTATSPPYATNWVSTMGGTWSLSALAIDSLGNSQFSSSVTATVYVDSNGDGIPDYLQVSQGNDPMNPWIPPSGDTNVVPPTINLVVPANATLLP